MNSISLGRYVPYNSIVHKLDPRNKLFCVILLMVAIFIPFSFKMTFIVDGVLAVLIFAILLISKVSLIEIFKSLRVLWFVVLVILLINVLIPSNVVDKTNIAFTIGTLPIYWESIFQSLKVVLRLILMIELTMILTSTTKPLDLTYALEWFMTPLKVIKFPVHEVAMVISIALRFIPTLLDETLRIMKAQESRGIDFKHGKISKRIKAMTSLIIPLFISAFQRSEELADSMEARGYNPEAKRTRYRVLKFHYYDFFSFVFIVVLFVGVILLKSFGVTL